MLTSIRWAALLLATTVLGRNVSMTYTQTVHRYSYPLCNSA